MANKARPITYQEASFLHRNHMNQEPPRRLYRTHEHQGPNLPPIHIQREVSEHHSPYMNRCNDEFVDVMKGDRVMDQGWGERSPMYQVQRPREQENGLGKVKVKLPFFEGNCNPDLYM